MIVELHVGAGRARDFGGHQSGWAAADDRHAARTCVIVAHGRFLQFHAA